MEKISRTNMSTFLESIIADNSADPEKLNRARHIVQKLREIAANQEKMRAIMKVIDPNDLEFSELLMKERDDLFYKMAYQDYALLCSLYPEKQSELQKEYEMDVKTYEREFSLNSR